MDDLALETRTGLPPALRALLDDLPRDHWQAHPDFHGRVSFWLDRHLAFRRLTAALRADTRASLDGRLAPADFARRLSQLGGHLVGDLHGHHQIEDHHYFPRLAAREPRLQAGFDLLDRDHQALDGHLAAFADSANAVLRSWRGPGLPEAAGGFLTGLDRLEAILDRHLADEEDLIVPVILRHGPQGL